MPFSLVQNLHEESEYAKRLELLVEQLLAH